MALGSVDDPLEHAHVFAITRPQVLAFALAKPIHDENLGWVSNFSLQLEPVRKIIAHVVTTERKHRHRVSAHDSNLTGGSCGGLRTESRTQKHSVGPIK